MPVFTAGAIMEPWDPEILCPDILIVKYEI